MFASTFVPLVHLDDHPEADVFAMKLKISLPSTVERFIQERLPGSERIELCYDRERVVVHHGWTPIAEGCQPGEGIGWCRWGHSRWHDRQSVPGSKRPRKRADRESSDKNSGRFAPCCILPFAAITQALALEHFPG